MSRPVKQVVYDRAGLSIRPTSVLSASVISTMQREMMHKLFWEVLTNIDLVLRDAILE